MSLVCDKSTCEVSYDVKVAGRCAWCRSIELEGTCRPVHVEPARAYSVCSNAAVLCFPLQGYYYTLLTSYSLCITWYTSVFTGFGYWCWRGSVRGMMSITRGVIQ